MPQTLIAIKMVIHSAFIIKVCIFLTVLGDFKGLRVFNGFFIIKVPSIV